MAPRKTPRKNAASGKKDTDAKTSGNGEAVKPVDAGNPSYKPSQVDVQNTERSRNPDDR